MNCYKGFVSEVSFMFSHEPQIRRPVYLYNKLFSIAMNGLCFGMKQYESVNEPCGGRIIG